jgi:hypothetical protein
MEIQPLKAVRCVPAPEKQCTLSGDKLFLLDSISTDAELTGQIRAILAHSPFVGEGYRKVWARLRLAGRGTAGYHVSLDMDWIDPEDAPGVGTPVRGGATYREAHLAMEIIADHGRMTSFEIVEVNPVIDEHNRTADLAVELALSAFGKKIL